MQHHEATCRSRDGLQLYYQTWQPETGIATVAIIHGLGGHSGQFQNVIDAFIPLGYQVYALDLRGHGRSQGQRGHINAWSDFRDDVSVFLHQIQQQEPHLPCFLWGHSLGGTVALDYALRSHNVLQGLILTAPALSQVNLSPFKLAIGQLLSRIWPRFSLNVGIRHEYCARDVRICEAYALDPLRHEYGSARLATEFFATMAWINAHISELHLPLLLLHGGADQVTLPAGSRAMFEQVTFPDKQYREYPDNYHDLHVDQIYPQLLRDIHQWMQSHLPDSMGSMAKIA